MLRPLGVSIGSNYDKCISKLLTDDSFLNKHKPLSVHVALLCIVRAPLHGRLRLNSTFIIFITVVMTIRSRSLM